MKKFERLEIEILALDREDIVTSSPVIPGENEGPFVPFEK